MKLSRLSTVLWGGLSITAIAAPTDIVIWRHLTNTAEMEASAAAIQRFNQSQHQWHIIQQNIPNISYTQSITAAAKAERLPCIIDLDQPLVPNFAWHGFLHPLDKPLRPRHPQGH
ncbi:hypothetical protein P4S72_20620 [Vibrio sp. PP-XX7]